MKKRRTPSENLTKIMESIDEDQLRRTRDRMNVAIKIADALKARQISQKAFAKLMGRSESEISEWLSGNRNFTIDTLSDIKKQLNIDLLNTTSMQTSAVSRERAKIKITKEKASVYCTKKTIASPNTWIPASTYKLSIAL
ncbi:MAG: helix-turn-helix transcriptional regulator [Bacteroidales bacterium]|nr:helix-turn-helix transcriptional regulator [Bacteroidales bacterium]